MPIYAYRCTSCGIQKDHLQKISDPVLTVCPECGEASYQKMLTAAGFQLKGSGWYATDFKGGAAAQASGDKDKGDKAKGGDAAKDGGAKESGSTDSGSKDTAPKTDSSASTSSSSPASTPSSTGT